MVQANIGTLDRDVRLVLTMVFLLLALFAHVPVLQVVSAVLGLAMFITAATAFSPVYGLLRISTVRS